MSNQLAAVNALVALGRKAWAQTNDFDFWIEVGVLTGPFAAWVSA